MQPSFTRRMSYTSSVWVRSRMVSPTRIFYHFITLLALVGRTLVERQVRFEVNLYHCMAWTCGDVPVAMPQQSLLNHEAQRTLKTCAPTKFGEEMGRANPIQLYLDPLILLTIRL